MIIKFRGKSVETKEWAEGSLIDMGNHSQLFIVPMFNRASTMTCNRIVANTMVAIIPETVGQFTGEQVYSEDEWTEVFVGDILYFTVFDCYGKDTQYTGTVIFDSGRFQIECKGQNYDDSDICFDLYEMLQQDDEAKVIGNKHEDPELLESK